MAATADGPTFKAILIDLAGAWLQLGTQALTNKDGASVDMPARTIRDEMQNGDLARQPHPAGIEKLLLIHLNAEVGFLNNCARNV
jgi:hypothetical protein